MLPNMLLRMINYVSLEREKTQPYYTREKKFGYFALEIDTN